MPFDHLPDIDPVRLRERRERVFLVMAGLFLGTLAMLNILGISRFIALASFTPGESGSWTWGEWGEVSFALAVGVLPYPLTFLCTDLISEFYGRRRANFMGGWIGDGRVRVRFARGGTRDAAGRRVGYVDTEGEVVVNERLLAEGLARTRWMATHPDARLEPAKPKHGPHPREHTRFLPLII